MNIAASFSLKRFFGIGVIFVVGLTLVGCGGFKKKKEQPAEKPAAEQKGSLSRTFTVVDEQGRNAGTLILDFSGGAVLQDANGKVIGTFKPAESAETQPSETQSKPQAAEVQSEPEPPAFSTLVLVDRVFSRVARPLKSLGSVTLLA